MKKAKELALTDGENVPILIVTGSRNLLLAPLSFIPDTHDQRLDLMQSIGQIVGKSGKIGQLRQVFLISEGWMSIASDEKRANMRPSQDPDRKEVLIISGLQIEGLKKSLKLFEMVRNQNKQVVDLLEISPPQGKDGRIEIPLLEAFSQGFQLAKLAREN